ncbi:uncharacterized protein LOC116109936 [Pistacia vera]|uniref:uncharacterized protein LOC116109936 n=1 Tax=Pistacia vera TaxID=55513 RepID=UPI00126336E2|nr:uncharacterized protein LOC116109936 [Pistacia vera]
MVFHETTFPGYVTVATSTPPHSAFQPLSIPSAMLQLSNALGSGLTSSSAPAMPPSSTIADQSSGSIPSDSTSLPQSPSTSTHSSSIRDSQSSPLTSTDFVPPCSATPLTPICHRYHSLYDIMASSPHVLLHALTEETLDPMLHEPTSFKQAQYVSHWHQAICEKCNALLRNNTWVLVLPSPHQNLVGCCWVYKVRRQVDGFVEQYKARLVAKGFHQQPGVDFGDTFSPIVKPITIHTILALATMHGSIGFFLGMEVVQDNIVLCLSQQHYVVDLLRRFQLDSCAPCATPFSSSKASQSSNDDLFPDVTLYRSMIGGLQYLTLTRSDTAFAVNQVAQRLSAPTQHDMCSIKRIFLYLKGTLFHGLTFHHVHLLAYSDVDWVADVITRRSISSGCVFLGRNLISWTAKKQYDVSRSSAESEYRALAYVIADIRWFCYLLRELGIPLYSSSMTINQLYTWQLILSFMLALGISISTYTSFVS